MSVVLNIVSRFDDRGVARAQKRLADLGSSAKGFSGSVSADLIKTGATIDRLSSKASTAGAMLSKSLTLPLVGAAAVGVKQASDLNEAMNKVEVVFGKTAASVERFAQDSATSLGMSRAKALEAAGTYGNLFTAMGIGEQRAAEMSTSMVSLAADLASFNNASPEEALQALRSGLAGETEPLKRFGVNLNEATLKAQALKMGIADGKSVLTPAQKAQAAYALILKQTTKAQGDFARTSDGTANQMRILRAQADNAAATFGQTFLPIATRLLGWGNDLMKRFQSLSPETQKLIGQIALVAGAIGPSIFVLGKLGSTVGGAVSAVGNLGLAFGKNAAAAPLWARTVAGAAKGAVSLASAAVQAAGGLARQAAAAAIATGRQIAHTAATVAAKAAQLAIAGATKAWAAAQWLINAALSANPIGLVIAALAALAVGLLVAYRKSETFREIVNKAFSVVKTVAGAVLSFLGERLSGFGDKLRLAWSLGEKMRDKLGAAFAAIREAAKTVWSGITASFRSGYTNVATWINKLIGAVNWLLGKLHLTTLGTLPVGDDGSSRSTSAAQLKAVMPGAQAGTGDDSRGGILDWFKGTLWGSIKSRLPKVPELPFPANAIPDYLLDRVKQYIGRLAAPGSVGTGSANVGGAGYAWAYELAKRFGLIVTSTFRPGAITAAGYPSDHGVYGRAADIAGPWAAMSALWRFVKATAGSWKQAIFGHEIINYGRLGYYAPSDHFDHVHLARAAGDSTAKSAKDSATKIELSFGSGVKASITGTGKKAVAAAKEVAEQIVAIFQSMFDLGEIIAKLEGGGLPTKELAKKWAGRVAGLVTATINAMSAELAKLKLGKDNKNKDRLGAAAEMAGQVASIFTAFAELTAEAVDKAVTGAGSVAAKASLLGKLTADMVNDFRAGLGKLAVDEQIKDRAGGAGSVLSSIADLITTFAELTAEAVDKAVTGMQAAQERAGEIGRAAVGIVDGVREAVGALDAEATGALAEQADKTVSIARAIADVIGAYMEFAGDAIDAALAGLRRTTERAPELGEHLRNMVTALQKQFAGLTVTQDFQDLVAGVAAVTGGVSSIMRDLGELTEDAVQAGIAGAETVAWRANQLGASIARMVDKLTEALGVLDVTEITEIDKIAAAIRGLAESIAGIVNSLADITDEKAAAATAAGDTLGRGFYDGLKAWHAKITAEAASIAADAAAALNGGGGGGGGLSANPTGGTPGGGLGTLNVMPGAVTVTVTGSGVTKDAVTQAVNDALSSLAREIMAT